MCGIHCCISTGEESYIDARTAELLARRGPDTFQTHRTSVKGRKKQWILTMRSSVLSLRGEQAQVQPIVDDVTQSVFCWNGEAWTFAGKRVCSNDTKFIASHLFDSIKSSPCPRVAILEIISQIEGPYAFVLYDARSHDLYFGRDPLGRRSLLVSQSGLGDSEFNISSIVTNDSKVACEVDTSHIYCVDLKLPLLRMQNLPRTVQLPRIAEEIPSNVSSFQSMPSDQSVSRLLSELTTAIQLRVEAVPTYTAQGSFLNPSKVAVLFSGGLDCTLLARLVHDLLPPDQPIDLLNVAFENPRVVTARASERSKSGPQHDTYESCPDRMTGRTTFNELTEICPRRAWRFVAINVPYQEFQAHRPTIVRLMFPHNTEMDLSITSALYFAARGKGEMVEATNLSTRTQPYTTTARVLLSGLGADELFGGYARHAAAFNRGGYPALIEELKLDFVRIGQRNLGRDDRATAHWGRETRYPFLDETFIKLALNLPVWEKCGFRAGKTITKHFETTTLPEEMEDLHPEKMLLRCAMFKLNMKRAAAEKKRAIQFGARTAKMHAGRTKGTDLITVEASDSRET